MSTHRLVQCFGTLVRPRKPARPCRRKYLWTARGASANNFGRKGVQACPHCGTMPDFVHPINRMLNREISQQEMQETFKKDYDPVSGLKKAE